MLTKVGYEGDTARLNDHFPEGYSSNTFSDRVFGSMKTRDRVGAIIGDMKDVISSRKKGLLFGSIFAGVSSISTPVYSDNQDEIIDSTLQTIMEEEKNARLLRLEIYGIPTFDMAEYTDEDNFLYYLVQLDNPSVGSQVGMLLEQIRRETGYSFGWIDIPVIANLVIARQSGDYVLWEQAYDDCLRLYPVLREELVNIFSATGYNP